MRHDVLQGHAFHSSPSAHLWENEDGEVHTINQGMLPAIQRGTNRDEKLVFLDDLCIVPKPQRVGTLHSAAQRELCASCRMWVHGGKTPELVTNQRRATGCREWQKLMTPQLRCGADQNRKSGFGHTCRRRRVRAFVVGEDSS